MSKSSIQIFFLVRVGARLDEDPLVSIFSELAQQLHFPMLSGIYLNQWRLFEYHYNRSG